MPMISSDEAQVKGISQCEKSFQTREKNLQIPRLRAIESSKEKSSWLPYSIGRQATNSLPAGFPDDDDGFRH